MPRCCLRWGWVILSRRGARMGPRVTPPASRVQDTGMPHTDPKLSSTLTPTWGRRCRRRLVPGAQQLAGWTAVAQAHIGAAGSELGHTGIGSGLVTCTEWVPIQSWSPADPGPARYPIHILLVFYRERCFLSGIRLGCKTWAHNFLLCRNQLCFEIPGSGKF